MSKKLLAGLLLLLLAGGFVYTRVLRKQTARVAYQTAKVEKGDVASAVTATGTLNAVTTVQVGSQLSGIILKLHADFNSIVKSGELLAELDPATYSASVEQGKADVQAAETAVLSAQTDLKTLDAEILAAKAGLATARANLRKAEAGLTDKEQILKRSRALAARQLTATQDLDTAIANRSSAAADVDAAKAGVQTAETKILTAQAARANGDAKIASARAQLAQKRAALDLAAVNLARTRIHSPIDGVIISRSVDVGQTVAASLAAPVLFSIANDLRRMQIDANVDEADIGRVKVGHPVDFTVDAFPDDKFKGKVVQMRLQPIVSQNVVTYDTVIQVSNDQLLLRPGMTASVKIQTAAVKGVLKVPSGAFGYKPAVTKGQTAPEPPVLEKGHRLLYVQRGDAAAPVDVVAGISDGSFTQISGGSLEEGDAVIVGDESDASEQSTQTNPFAPRRR